ncbi:uncharacterized protein LOC123557156 isoform X2 [Mercenaria mercenaria]|uniref:uncharacterized protein LOC123557156 isoform X2 n=1 Tax=Mercenaria mercenaria TaxID=6596 RepID=UPI00234F2E13|nr:uncharacterized protein LOC123557156 isoform X2 [Mercenaria mercenaria]
MNVKMREVLIMGAVFILKVSGQYTFPSPWASSTWLDNTRGIITFGTTTMTGWSTTVFNQQISSWQCVDSSSSTTLVMRSTQSVTYSTTAFYAFLCMKFTQLSTNSYSYVQQQAQQQNAGYERLWFSSDSTLSTVSTICDSSASIPTLEFHVLVKQGMGDSAAITFPNNLLFSADYKYMASDGTVACNNTSDTVDMCTDTKALSFNNYTNCKQEIAYSAGGELWCVATASLSSYDCAVVFNRDATISGTASQSACLCSDGSSVSVVSGNCTSDQTPSSYPTAADGTTVIGYRLTIESVYAPTTTTTTTTTGSSGLCGGVIAAIVIIIIVIIVIIVVSIFLYKHGHCVKICNHLNGCHLMGPCWAACRNKVCVCCKNKIDGAK